MRSKADDTFLSAIGQTKLHTFEIARSAGCDFSSTMAAPGAEAERPEAAPPEAPDVKGEKVGENGPPAMKPSKTVRTMQAKGNAKGKAKAKKSVEESPLADADSQIKAVRSSRDEKRRLQMSYNRATDLSTGKSYEQGNPKKIPAALIPMHEGKPEALFDLFFENNGNWGNVLMEVTKTSTKKSQRKGKRRWVFESELINEICKGNSSKAMQMKKNLLSDPKRHRVHPDMDAKDTDSIQYHALAFEEDDELSEDEEKLQVSAKASIQGSDDQVRKAISGALTARKSLLSAELAKAAPAAKAKAAPAAKAPPPAEGSKRWAATTALSSQTASTSPQQSHDQGQEERDEARKEAEKKKKEAEQQRKKEEPLERSKVWLGAVPLVLRDLDIASKDANSKTFKNHVPDRFTQDFAKAFEDHRRDLLEDRAKFEQISGLKDAKSYKKKCDFVDDAEDHLNGAKKTLRAWKHTAHVFLQESKK